MDLKRLEETAPWDWPRGTDQALLHVLTSATTSEPDRTLAAELAGDYSVINDALAAALLQIVESAAGSDELRCRAAIALGPVLEQADVEGFDEPENIPISEPEFHRIRETLHRIYQQDGITPEAVRRGCLEASVRAPQEWHSEAVRSAYESGDTDWMRTAVFCMREIRGFDEQILEALESDNPIVHYHAVVAAGNWGVEDAWPHIADLVVSEETEKPVLLAAIEAAAMIRPDEAEELFFELMDCDDEEIVEAIDEALALAAASWRLEPDADEDYEFDDEDDNGRRH